MLCYTRLRRRLLKEYLPKYGPIRRILSDRGTQFTSRLWQDTLKKENIKPIFTSVRHPQANPSERIMRELGRLFRTYCSQKHTHWAYEVPKIQKFLNEIIHESTGFSPSELQFDFPRLRLLPEELRAPDGITEPPLEVKFRLASECLSKKGFHRSQRNPGKTFVEFKEGDLVLLKANNISSAITSELKKFLLLFEGPFRIKKKIHAHTYLLIYPNESFHASHLKAYHVPTYVPAT